MSSSLALSQSHLNNHLLFRPYPFNLGFLQQHWHPSFTPIRTSPPQYPTPNSLPHSCSQYSLHIASVLSPWSHIRYLWSSSSPNPRISHLHFLSAPPLHLLFAVSFSLGIRGSKRHRHGASLYSSERDVKYL